MSTPKNTLKQWFSNGKKPDEQQFWAWLESYWHKDEKIPIETIQDIQNILSGKANTELISEILKKLDGKADKETVQLLEDYVHALINDTISGVDTTYSSSKINELISNILSPDIVENSTTTALTYEILQSTYPEASAGDVVICANAGYKYEKTQEGWIQYVINKLFPIPVIKPDYKLTYSNISSSTFDEINRTPKITITEVDAANKKFKCNLSDLNPLKVLGTDDRPWFVVQGDQASNYCEILSIDEAGFIYYSEAILGIMDMTVGKTIEFFNPFVNYQILNNECPALAIQRSNTNEFVGYPRTINGKSFTYLYNGGILKRKSDNKYVQFLCASNTGETFVATDADINGHFSLESETPFFDNATYPTDRSKGTTSMWGVTVLPDIDITNVDNNAKYIGVMSIKDGQGNQYPGYVFLDDNGSFISGDKIRDAKGLTSYLRTMSTWTGGWHITGLSYYEDEWHIIAKNWASRPVRETYHIILKSEYFNNLTIIEDTVNVTNAIKSCTLLHRQNNYDPTPNSVFYGQADFSLFNYNDKFYMFYNLEPIATGFITSMNRVTGMAKWNKDTSTWNYEKGLQILNPIQLFRKYSHLAWCWDHSGNLVCPFAEDENIYLGVTFASDNPDYFPAILKMRNFQ